jgi:hypothetical protein
MAGDDEKDKADGFDPWADLVSETSADAGDAPSFSFADPSPSPADIAPPAVDDAAHADTAAEPTAHDDAAVGDTPADHLADDDLVNGWLDDTAGDLDAAAPLTVFPPDESGDIAVEQSDVKANGSSIEIGTGTSGIESPSSAESIESLGDEPVEPMEADDSGEQQIDVIDFGAAAAVAAAGATAAAAPAPKKKKKFAAKPRPKSAIGQMIGVVGGGVMAIPITLAILIWGLQKDPFKVTKYVPEEVAFLLPAKFQKGYVKPMEGGPDLSKAPSLDDLPSSDTAVPDSPMPDLGTEEPAAAEPATSEPEIDVASLTPAEPPAPPPAPEPEPLDVSALETALASASSALDGVKAVEDPADPVRKKLLVEWYKQLARVAQELAMLEHVAADSGRPLTQMPEGVARLHASIVARPDLVEDLSRLSRNWLAYSKRGGDGIVVPVTFAGARHVGPYWASRATIIEAGGKPREIAIISRAEPAAVPGDLIIVTGLVLDGGVFWAADLRPASGGGAPAEPTSEPFALPEL